LVGFLVIFGLWIQRWPNFILAKWDFDAKALAAALVAAESQRN